MVVHSDSDFATVSYLRIKDANLEDKISASSLAFRVPPLLSDDHEKIRQLLDEIEDLSLSNLSTNERCQQLNDGQSLITNSVRRGRWITVSNVQTIEAETSLEEEIKSCFLSLQGE